MLDLPVFWVHSTDYLFATLIAATLTILWLRVTTRFPFHYLLIADAFGLALFNVVGLEKAWMNGVPMATAIAMGTITGVFGGLLRDVLCREVPLVFNGELYAITCILGGLAYALVLSLGFSSTVCSIVAVVTTVLLRFGALRWHWQLQVFRSD